MRVAGQRIPHESARGHVTGDALYTDDVALRLAGVLHAWPVMAPHAHALLTHLNTVPALAEPGVVATLTAADVPGEGDSGSIATMNRCFPWRSFIIRKPWRGYSANRSKLRGWGRPAWKPNTVNCPRSSQLKTPSRQRASTRVRFA